MIVELGHKISVDNFVSLYIRKPLISLVTKLNVLYTFIDVLLNRNRKRIGYKWNVYFSRVRKVK